MGDEATISSCRSPARRLKKSDRAPDVHLLSLIEVVRLKEAAAQHAATHTLAVKIMADRIARLGDRHYTRIADRRNLVAV